MNKHNINKIHFLSNLFLKIFSKKTKNPYNKAMSHFDFLFFEQHINDDEKIEKVFHRHIFVMIEDLLLWLVFGLVVPSFLFYHDVFGVRTILDSTWIHAYLFLLYFILIYKVFDWYLDVWIATDATLVEMRWKWFTPQLMYIPYDKIESIEVRTKSWLYSIVGISDVRINMAGDEFHTLSSAEAPKDMVNFIQDKTRPAKPEDEPDNREPFEIMVDTLSGIVKNHLDHRPHERLTPDYVEKLDTTLSYGVPIDLRSIDEKNYVDEWKKKHEKKIKIEEKSE